MSKTDTEPKKFVREYQPKDEQGNPIGPIQHFEADTREELIDKIAAAHENASAKLYQTRRAVKLGEMLEPDPDQPILTFQGKQLTADERVAVSTALKDPKTAPDALRTLLEAELGAPVEEIRKALRQIEIDKRTHYASQQVDSFLADHPEYVQCDSNQETFEKYLKKRNMAITKKNLEIAYEDLVADGLLVIQRKIEPEKPTPPKEIKQEKESSVSAETVETTASSSVPAIPEQTTSVPPINETETVPPRTSPIGSSGLSRDSGSKLPPPVAPKAPGITAADIRKMTAEQYAKFVSDPNNRKAVEALYAKK